MKRVRHADVRLPIFLVAWGMIAFAAVAVESARADAAPERVDPAVRERPVVATAPQADPSQSPDAAAKALLEKSGTETPSKVEIGAEAKAAGNARTKAADQEEDARDLEESFHRPAGFPSPSVWPWGDPMTITTPDGMILRGLYHPPRQAGGTVVVLTTGGRGDFVAAFRLLAARLGAKGYGIAALDCRGVGLSTENVDGSSLDLAARMTDRDLYQKIVEDTVLLVRTLRESKGVRPFRVVLCGSSIGANVAILAAAEAHRDVRAVVAISPGTNYRGLIPLNAAISLDGRGILAVGAGSDAPAYTFVQEMRRSLPAATTQIVGGGAHGHALLDTEMVERIAIWLDEH